MKTTDSGLGCAGCLVLMALNLAWIAVVVWVILTVAKAVLGW